MGELLYCAARRDNKQLSRQVRDLIRGALTVLPFDESAAEVYGSLRASSSRKGKGWTSRMPGSPRSRFLAT